MIHIVLISWIVPTAVLTLGSVFSIWIVLDASLSDGLWKYVKSGEMGGLFKLYFITVCWLSIGPLINLRLSLYYLAILCGLGVLLFVALSVLDSIAYKQAMAEIHRRSQRGAGS